MDGQRINLPNPVAEEKANSSSLTLKILNPHVEGYGETAIFTLEPTQVTLPVADWRNEVNLSEINAAIPGYEAERRNIVIIDLDQQEPIISTYEFATSENPMDRGYRLVNKITISNGQTDYTTSFEGMMAALKTGIRTQIADISSDSLLQRHVIGVAQAGDLADKTVFADYRFVDPEDSNKIPVDALMIYGSQAKMKEFLEKLAKTKAPVTTHSPPAFDRAGRATW